MNKALKKKPYKRLYRRQRRISALYFINTILWIIVAIKGINIQCYINPVFANTIQEEQVIEETIEEVVEEKPAYTVSAEERQLLAKLLWAEGRGESYDCQKAIISVVMNRVMSKDFPNTIKEVVYQKNQFEPVSNGMLDRATPYKQLYDAVDEVIAYGSTVPEWVCYFRASYHFGWQGYEPFCRIDNTYFGGFEK